MSGKGRWWPTQGQLGKQTEEGLAPTTEHLERTFREVLRLHYELVDSHEELLKKVSTLKTPPKPAQPTNTASITRILGLPIQPSDTSQLADGTKLTWVAAERVFRFL
jgi:hypothetical protein